jgi:molecular chaperone DnaK
MAASSFVRTAAIVWKACAMAEGPGTPASGAAYRLGVDLGTTFTAAAVGDGGVPWVLGLGNRALQVPSVVFLGAEGGFLVGEAAERRGTAEPDRLVREFKRRLGDKVPLMVGGVSVTAEELMGHLLRWVVDRAVERMGGPPNEVVVTYPANWGPFKIGLLDEIVTLAGIGTWRGCPEPVAAAVQYAASVRVAVGDRLAVYDLGGGTFDVCVLEKTEDGFAVLGTPEGVEQLGGVDFDDLVFGLVWDSLGEKVAALDADDDAVTVGLARLRRECVEAKEALSGDVDGVVPVSLPGLSTAVRITRSEFESLIRPSLEATVAGLNRALRSASVEAKDLRAIVLVGGSSRIPLVAEMLQREFGVPTALDIHPKHDVALGAVRVGESGLSTGVGNAPAAIPASSPGPAAAATSLAAGAAGNDSTMPRSLPAPPAQPHGQFPPAEFQSGDLPADFQAGQPPPTFQPEQMAAESQPGQGVPAGFPPGQPADQFQPVSFPPSQPDQLAAPQALEGQPNLTGAGPGGAPPGAPAAAAGSAIRRRPPLAALIIVAAAVVAGVLAGFGYVYLGGNPSTPGNPATSTSAGDSPTGETSATATENPSTTPTDEVRTLPRSTPLTDTQILVPVLIDGSYDIYLGDTDAEGPVRPLIEGGGNDTNPSLSPDRATMIYSHDGRLRVAAVDGSDSRDLFDPVPDECAKTMTRPAWDPSDPTRIASACQNADGTWGLYVIRLDGTVLKKLSEDDDKVGDPGYSPDGAQVVFWAAPADSGFDGGELFIANANGDGKPRRLTKSTATRHDADPAWSPNGNAIAFRRREKSNSDVYVVAADGSQSPRALADDPADEQDPSWSPAGDEIAYKSIATSPDWPDSTLDRVWLMDSDGGGKRVLWTKAVRLQAQTAPAWTSR